MGFHFATAGKLSLEEALFYFEKDSLRDPVKYGDFFESIK
jgi:hypothetical protein